MEPPMRKRLRPYTVEEINYIQNHYGNDPTNRIHNSDEEYDIPPVDKLEKLIEESFKKINGKPLDVYKKFIGLTDKFNDLYKQYSPCRKGCGSCCKIPVLISEMEKNIIKRFLEETNEISKYVYNKIPLKPITKNGILGGNYLGTNCPFLEDGECKIYSVRPYKCRGYISIDDSCSEKFESDFENDTQTRINTPIHIYSEIIYERIVEYYYKKKNIDIRLNDIRDFFLKI
jgi:Fe-S-cluster containining protein